MKIEKMFETATRNKFRFQFNGVLNTEDLWDLSVENLDAIFKALNSELKKATEESLLNTKSKEDEKVELKIAIVRYVVSVKIEENSSQLKEKEIKEQKQKIMELIESKKNEGLQSKTLEELQEELNKLEE